MASTRAVPGEGDGGSGVALLGSAAALRWSRPDLTGALADHVREICDADADPADWLRAAGWVVSARSATGDGRPVASEVLDGVVRRGVHVLDDPAADRLRVELAVLATGAGRLSTARALLTPVSVADTGPELRADALGALARCAVEDRPAAVAGLLRRVESVWAEIGGPRGHIGTAAAALVAATAERRAGRPDAAVAKAADGLAHLDSARAGRSQTPSRHLAAGLAAEWISGLLDAGRADEARDGCVPLEARLRDTSRPSRQMALLRLAVARTVTASGAQAVIEALVQAARDAAASDVPDLESVCLSTLGALQQKAGQLERGLESVRLGVAAQRRDQQRAERFRQALDAAVSPLADEGLSRAATNGGRVRTTGHHRSVAAVQAPPPSAPSWTDWSSVARDHRPAGSSGTAQPTGDPAPSATGSGRTQRPTTAAPANEASANGAATGNGRRSASDDTEGVIGHGPAGIGVTGDPTVTDPHGISPWRDWTDDSPIGHLLAQSLRSRGDGPGAAAPHPESAPPAQAPPTGQTPTSRTPSSAPTRFVADEGAPATENPVPAGDLPIGGGRADRRERRGYPDAVADPWATGWSSGSWSTGRRAGKDEPAASDTDPAPSGRTGRRRRVDADEASSAVPAPPTAPGRREKGVQDGPSRWYDRYEQSRTAGRAGADRAAADRAAADRVATDRVEAAADLAVEPGSGSWLQNALAELDRAWTAAGTSGPADRRPEPGPEADGCVVVIDLARDGRRFAGRRAGAVIRAIGDRLGDRLPSGARVRHDDGDALSVVLPGWSRSPATEWMHRTLPGLFETFVPDEDLPDTQLRAAVHDADGPVGAQLLQRLDRPRRRHATRDALSTGPIGDGALRTDSLGTDSLSTKSLGTDSPATDSLATDPLDRLSPDHDALWGALPSEPVPAAAPPAAEGRRHRRPVDESAATGQDVLRDAPPPAGRSEQPDSTDGLGLADLLAGALAAYRGI